MPFNHVSLKANDSSVGGSSPIESYYPAVKYDSPVLVRVKVPGVHLSMDMTGTQAKNADEKEFDDLLSIVASCLSPWHMSRPFFQGSLVSQGGFRMKRSFKDVFAMRPWPFRQSRRSFLKASVIVGAAATGATVLGSQTFVEAAKAATTPQSNAFDVLQAAAFSAKSGAVTAETSSEGGQDLGSITNGNWVSYTAVDFGSGADRLTARVSSDSGTGGAFDVYLDSLTGTHIGTVTVPNTENWQLYTTATTAITPTKGIHNLYFVFRSVGGSSSILNLSWFQFSTFHTFGLQITLLAENNSGLNGQIVTETAGEGINSLTPLLGTDFGNIANGDWAKFSAVNFGSGYNVVEARVATEEASGAMDIRIDSTTGTLLGTITAHNTGDWQTYTSVVQAIKSVSGVHDVYLIFRSTGSSSIMNLTWLKFINGSIPATSQTLFQAANYVTYFNQTAGNSGTYDRQDDVDIESRDGGYTIGYTRDGEWLGYLVNLPQGTYNLSLRVATTVAQKSITVYYNNMIISTVAVPVTGNWGTFTTVTLNDVYLSGGPQFLRLEFNGGEANLHWFQFTANSSTTFTPVWSNLTAKYEVPTWFRDAKFGIYFHWGVWSVPAYNSEWYPRNMYITGSSEYRHQLATYGSNSLLTSGYKGFIPDFTGSQFNATDWVSLFKQAGAKYIVQVGEHHDGFAMHNSAFTPYNAANMGLHFDPMAQLEQAVRAADLKWGVTSHYVFNYAYYTQSINFDTSNPLYSDLYGDGAVEGANVSLRHLKKWYNRTTEMVTNYEPDLVYFDFDIQFPGCDPYNRAFASYYYNLAKARGQQPVITYKNGNYPAGSAILDFERGGENVIEPFVWQTDTSICSSSWGYVTNCSLYENSAWIVTNLVDIVSKNGNLLLNIMPTDEGIIPSNQQTTLMSVGNWLKYNGEAIYETRPFTTFGEGPDNAPGGSFNENVKYTGNDVRYTTNGNTIYAIVLGWRTTPITMASLAKISVSSISMLGSSQTITWSQNSSGLTAHFPSTQPSFTEAFTFKIVTK